MPTWCYESVVACFQGMNETREFVGPLAQHNVGSPNTGSDNLVLSVDWTHSSGSIQPRTSRQNTIILQRKLRLAHRWRESVALIEYPETASQRLDDARAHPNVVVAIPAFNEGPTIGSVVLKARQFASEVVVRWGKTSGMPFYRRIGKRALDYATAAAA